MQYQRIVGLEKPLARVVQGTMMLREDDSGRAFALLDDVFAHGGTTFDTAHVYGGGAADRLLGQWMEQRGNRSQVVVVAKGCHHNADRKRLTAYDMAGDVADILARLRSDYIDLFLLHRDDATVPVAVIVDALAEHHAAGRIHAYGGSNWSLARLQEANAYAERHGLPPFRASSPNYSLAVQREAPWPDCVSISGADAAAEREWYRASGFPLLVWSSLAGGFFSGRFQRDRLDQLTDSYDQLGAKVYGSEDNFRRYDAAAAIAADRGVTAAQVALAYVLRSGLNVFALVGSRTTQELADNAAAVDIELDADEIAALELRDR